MKLTKLLILRRKRKRNETCLSYRWSALYFYYGQNDQIVKALESAKKTQVQIQSLNTQYTQSQAQVTNLRNKFAKHNLEGLAMSKPLLLQSKINKATARVGQDLTNITNADQFDEKATNNTATTN